MAILFRIGHRRGFEDEVLDACLGGGDRFVPTCGGDRLRRRVGVVPAVEQDGHTELAASPHRARTVGSPSRVRQCRRRMEFEAAEAVLIDGSAQRLRPLRADGWD